MSTGKPLHKRISTWLVALITAIALALPLGGGIAQAADPVIPDEALAAAIKEKLNLGESHELTQADVKKLTNLTVWERFGTVKSLEGLQYATELYSLQMPGHDVQDLSPLKGMQILDDITLNDNVNLKSLAPLSEVPNLTSVAIHNVPVDKLEGRLTPLTGLQKLARIAANRTGLTNADLKEIATIKTLDQLYLSENHISDFSPLSGFNFKQIFANGQQINLGKVPRVTEEDGGVIVQTVPFITPDGTDLRNSYLNWRFCDDKPYVLAKGADEVWTPKFNEALVGDEETCIAKILLPVKQGEQIIYSGTYLATPADALTVTFKPKNGEDDFTKTVLSGDPVAQPEDPVKEGFVFLGWFSDENKWDFTTRVEFNMTLTAKWEEKAAEVTVTFKPENGEGDFGVTVPAGSPVAKPKDPVKEGYVFLGWYSDTGKWNFDDPVNSDMTLTAQWEKAKDPEQPGTDVPVPPGGDNGDSDDSVKPDPEKPGDTSGDKPVTPKPVKPGKLPGTGV